MQYVRAKDAARTAPLGEALLALSHLEYPRRLGLDLFTYQRMEPFAGGEVNFDTEALLQQPLGCHQVQGIEVPARVIVDKNINVAFGTSLVAGG